MLSHSAQSRTSFTISPLLVIGVIFLALCVVEGLLAARFWLQLAASNAPHGIEALVLDLTHPLVTPFADAQASAQEVGSFERKTLLAAIAYLMAAVGLTVLTMVAGGVLSSNEFFVRRKRRSSLQHFEHPLIDTDGGRLVGTATINLSPAQAERALKMLRLDRLGTQLYVIPASGGCIVAAFAGAGGTESSLPLFGRIGAMREAMAVKRAFHEIESRFQNGEPQPGLRS